MNYWTPKFWVCNRHQVQGSTKDDSYQQHCDNDHGGHSITVSWTDDENKFDRV